MSHAETIAAAAEKTNAKPAKKDAELEQLGQALGEGFNRLDTSMTAAAARIEEAVEEVRPAFRTQAELGAAMTGAGIGCVAGAVGGGLVARRVSADGVVPSRLDVAEGAYQGALGGAFIGFAVGGLTAKVLGLGRGLLASRRAKKLAPSGE